MRELRGHRISLCSQQEDLHNDSRKAVCLKSLAVSKQSTQNIQQNPWGGKEVNADCWRINTFLTVKSGFRANWCCTPAPAFRLNGDYNTLFKSQAVPMRERGLHNKQREEGSEEYRTQVQLQGHVSPGLSLPFSCSSNQEKNGFSGVLGTNTFVDWVPEMTTTSEATSSAKQFCPKTVRYNKINLGRLMWLWFFLLSLKSDIPKGHMNSVPTSHAALIAHRDI